MCVFVCVCVCVCECMCVPFHICSCAYLSVSCSSCVCVRMYVCVLRGEWFPEILAMNESDSRRSISDSRCSISLLQILILNSKIG